MSKKIIWYSIVLLFVLGFGVFAGGFYKAFEVGAKEIEDIPIAKEERDKSKEVIKGNTEPAEENIEFFVLGDSLARGTGDKSKKGFVGNVVELLRSTINGDINLNNVAVEGMKSEELVKQLGDNKIKEGIKEADIIFISIGGNDLRGIQRVELGKRDEAYKEISKEYMENLGKIMGSIREVNSNSIVLFLGLYNLDYNNEEILNTEKLMEWNFKTQKLIEQDKRAIYVPSYDLFKLNFERFMSPDGLHPNGLGYKAIGERMTDVIKPLFINKEIVE